MGSIRALKKKAVLYLIVAEVFKIPLHQLSYQSQRTLSTKSRAGKQPSPNRQRAEFR
jgi:hypothetical protein